MLLVDRRRPWRERPALDGHVIVVGDVVEQLVDVYSYVSPHVTEQAELDQLKALFLKAAGCS